MNKYTYMFLKQVSPEMDDFERKNVGRKRKTIGKNVFKGYPCKN